MKAQSCHYPNSTPPESQDDGHHEKTRAACSRHQLLESSQHYIGIDKESRPAIDTLASAIELRQERQPNWQFRRFATPLWLSRLFRRRASWVCLNGRDRRLSIWIFAETIEIYVVRSSHRPLVRRASKYPVPRFLKNSVKNPEQFFL
jgi:hypothetical protein